MEVLAECGLLSGSARVQVSAWPTHLAHTHAFPAVACTGTCSLQLHI